jgi:hypothetical protein
MTPFLPSTPNKEHPLQINNLLAESIARTHNEQQPYSACQQSEMDKKQN